MSETYNRYFNIDKKTILLFLATLVWMGAIFWFSSQPADDSAALSGELAQMLKGLINGLFKGDPPDFIVSILFGNQYFIRKMGHFVEFFILGILVSSLIGRQNFKRKLLISILICLLYAVSDETHQMFVPGRGPMVTDVLLDVFASSTASYLVFLRRQYN